MEKILPADVYYIAGKRNGTIRELMFEKFNEVGTYYCVAWKSII